MAAAISAACRQVIFSARDPPVQRFPFEQLRDCAEAAVVFPKS